MKKKDKNFMACVVKYSSLGESLPYLRNQPIRLPTLFFLSEQKEIGHENVFFRSKVYFSKMSIIAKKNLSLCKTCYFVSKKFLAMMVSVDFDVTSLIFPRSLL